MKTIYLTSDKLYEKYTRAKDIALTKTRINGYVIFNTGDAIIGASFDNNNKLTSVAVAGKSEYIYKIKKGA